MTIFGLCMIVRNEEHIITQCLESVYKYIGRWDICDTGSTDNTVKIIENFFRDKNIPGQVHHHEWKGFSHNRSLAFQMSEPNCDMIYIIDADDKLLTPLVIPPECTMADSLIIELQEGRFVTQKRQQIFRSGLQWGYSAVVHEYPYSKINPNPVIMETTKIKVLASRGGDRSKDPLKYWRDALLMQEDLKRIEKIPPHKLPHWEKALESRYHYYISQSWYDFHHYEECIKWCDSRCKFNGFKEEIYRALLNKGRCLRALGRDSKEVIKAFQACHENDRFRSEAAFEILNEYERMGNYKEAWEFLQKIQSIKRPKDKMFIVEDYVYTYGKNEKASTLSFKLGKYKDAYKYADILYKLCREIGQMQYANNLKKQCIPFLLQDYCSYESITIHPSNKNDITFKLLINDSTESAQASLSSFLATCNDFRDIDKWVYISETRLLELEKLFPFLVYGDETGTKMTIVVSSNDRFYHKINLIEYIQDCKKSKIHEYDQLDILNSQLATLRKHKANNDILGPKISEIVSMKRLIAEKEANKQDPKIIYLNGEPNEEKKLNKLKQTCTSPYVLFGSGTGLYSFNFETSIRQ